MKPAFLCLTCVILLTSSAYSQQTVFNVPSADVLERGKVYLELDGTYTHSANSGTLTPRAVVGLGYHLEAGINLNGFNVPGKQAFTPTPTIKWKILESKESGWSWLAGDDLFIPAQHRTYSAGNYFWTEVAKNWNSGTRLTVGAYHATENVFGTRPKVGAQLAVERAVNERLSVATDWFSGDSSVGYVTPGLTLKISKQLTCYASYQLGNHQLSDGNHQFLFELGWNIN